MRLPKRIILVRHGESKGNLDGSAYTTTPDYKIPLTELGQNQARIAGQNILQIIQSQSESETEKNWKVYFYVSPYERTRSTLREIGKSFNKKRIIGVREECRIREQDFGNFQVEERMKAIKQTREKFGRFFFRFPDGESAADVFDRVSIPKLEERMKAIKQTREKFGRFFFRFPDGESAADVFDRVSSFLESLWRDIHMNRLQQDESEEINLVIVSHGLAVRVFLMKWFKWTVEQFEHLNNFRNCEVRVMQLGPGGEYSLAVHHSEEELEEWGLSPEMISDQKWRVTAARGDWNEKCSWYLDSFFDHLQHSCSEDDNDNDNGAVEVEAEEECKQ